jgi:hypothetical protein
MRGGEDKMYNKISSFHAEVHMKGFVNLKSVLLAYTFYTSPLI